MEVLITNNYIIEQIKSHTPQKIGVKKETAVFIPLISVHGEIHLLYQVRAYHLRNQPGDVAFPGGEMEAGEGSEQAAVRETCEELQLPKHLIEIYGRIDSLYTSFDALIHCYVGRLHVDVEQIIPSSDEVETIFTVPLSWLCTHPPEWYFARHFFELDQLFPKEIISNHGIKGSDYPVALYRSTPYIIWGITARITKQFIDIILPKKTV